MEAGIGGLILGALGFIVAAGNAYVGRRKYSLQLFTDALAEVRTERDECREERAEFRQLLVDNGLVRK